MDWGNGNIFLLNMDELFGNIKEQLDSLTIIQKNTYEAGYKKGFEDGKNAELKSQIEEQAKLKEDLNEGRI